MPKRLPRVIARSDLRRLLVHDRPHSFADLTGYVATELLFATGMRVILGMEKTYGGGDGS